MTDDFLTNEWKRINEEAIENYGDVKAGIENTFVKARQSNSRTHTLATNKARKDCFVKALSAVAEISLKYKEPDDAVIIITEAGSDLRNRLLSDLELTSMAKSSFPNGQDTNQRQVITDQLAKELTDVLQGFVTDAENNYVGTTYVKQIDDLNETNVLAPLRQRTYSQSVLTSTGNRLAPSFIWAVIIIFFAALLWAGIEYGIIILKPL